jgi:peptide deformylase
LFVVDGEPFDEENLVGFKKAFINAEILEESEEEWSFNEGCLSIPEVRAEVIRPDWIKMRYLDENFEEHIEEFDGLKARIIQHEYDHVDGILFTDYLSPLKRQMLKRKLDNISKGKIEVDYKMRFPKAKARR